MTLTYSIDHALTTTESVSVEVADKANLVLQSTTTDPKTGDVASVYVISNGDNSYPATVTYRVGLQKRSTGTIRRISVTFDTWATCSDSVSGTDTKKPISATVSFNVPADMTVETADMDDLLGNLVSYLYLSVAGGVRDTTWLAKLLFGIPQVK